MKSTLKIVIHVLKLLQVAMGLFIDCHFLFEVQLLKFCHLKIVSGAVDARKWECQVEKLEHFRLILLLEFNRKAKAAEAATNIFAVYGDNDIGESTARKCFSGSKEDRFDISDTPR